MTSLSDSFYLLYLVVYSIFLSNYYVYCRLCTFGLWRNRRIMIFVWNCEGFYEPCLPIYSNCQLTTHYLSYMLLLFSYAFRSKLHTYDDVVERVARQLG